MTTNFTHADLAQTLIVQLGGERYTNVSAGKHSAELKFEVTRYEDDATAITIGVNVTVRSSIDSAPLDAGDLIYTGSVAFLVRFKSEIPEDEDRGLVALMWPYLRSALLDHASRIGITSIKLPFVLPDGIEEIEDGEVAEVPVDLPI